MRTGEEYREALRDGRRVWVIGEGLVEDVTVHPATRATVDEYVAWYDRHFDPEWQDVLLTPPDAQGARAPWAYALPRSVQDLRAMGRSFSATTFLSAGNITHTPAYGNLIALGVLDAVQQRNVSPEQIANAAGHRELIARTGLRRDEVVTLADVGALNAFGYDRRSALWQAERAVRPSGELFDEQLTAETASFDRLRMSAHGELVEPRVLCG